MPAVITRPKFRQAIWCLLIMAYIAAILALPYQMRSRAQGLTERTKTHDPSLPNYDIRTDKKAFARLAEFRSRLGKQASDIADTRDGFVRGEGGLRRRLPTLKIEYNADICIPEVIGPDVRQGLAFLTPPGTPAGTKHVGQLVAFLKQNAELVGVSAAQVDGLKVAADYTNPDGNLSFVELDQEINGIPVFRGEVKAGFTKRGEMIRVVNNLASGLDQSTLPTDFGDPANAVKYAAGFIKHDLTRDEKGLPSYTNNSDKIAVFGTGDSTTTAEKMYFPTEPGVAAAAWRVLLWQPANAYYVIVDAATGTLLWRKNITEDQTQPATYGVYTNPNAMINVAHSPFPFSPGPISPNGAQGPSLGRSPVTKIGNEPPYTFNNLGWIPDGSNITDGNAVQAGLDRDGTDGVDPNSEAVGTNRNFTFAYNPFDPNTNTGDAPVPATQTYPGSAYQQGSVTQLFYICNWYHDELYRLGFNEQARNFQNDNFGRGGIAGDRVRGEGQDSSGFNNANFSTPADGMRGRMQMYLWTGNSPNIDGNFDADVVVHEHTHGLSNRLHGNGSGLSINMSRGMGEGWSDFYGLALLSQPSDPVAGIYTTGAYDTYRFSSVGTNNNYYGIRRFPYAVRSFTGGPNNLPHNPLSFADIDSTQQNLNDGAYPPRQNGASFDEVHNIGEVWCTMLWEIRGLMVTRLGWAAGNRRALQIVTDGMKLAPLGPTFITERDAIVAAAVAGGDPGDVADVWAGFATRGLGSGASIQNNGSGTGDTRVTEAYDTPNLNQAPDIIVSDITGNRNGYPDGGEHVVLTIPLTNNTGTTATGATLQISGGNSVSYGTMTGVSTVSRQIGFNVPAGTCGGLVTITLNVNSSLGPVTFSRSFPIGAPATTFSESFDTVTPPAIPSGWTVASSYAPITFVSTSTNADSPPNSMFAADLPVTGSTTDGGDTTLTSPTITLNSTAQMITFRHKYNAEPGWDGGVLEINIAGVTSGFQDIIDAGGTFVQNGYNSTLGVSSPNPLGGRSAWSGDSGGYITTVVRFPASAINHPFQLRWRFGTDNNTAPAGGGWNIDSISNTEYVCFSGGSAHPAPYDFDGDGRTDISIFRPSSGQWWYLRSNDGGNFAAQFGTSSDKITPGDFTGDGKADMAIWRPSTGEWFILRSEDFSYYSFPFGTTGDVPMPADYDGDGKTDAAVFRPSNSTWYINKSGGGITITTFGTAGDLPVAADYDGDGKADIAIYRPSNGQWWLLRSTAGLIAATFGTSTDKTVPGDYTGDGKADMAFYRPSTGEWFILRSENFSFYSFPFGTTGDVPSPGDYDGDGKLDATVFRPSTNTWYSNRSTAGSLIQPFGTTGDISVPNAFVR